LISVWSREVFNELSLERVEGEIFFRDLRLLNETYDLHLSMAGEGAEGIRFIDVSDEA